MRFIFILLVTTLPAFAGTPAMERLLALTAAADAAARQENPSVGGITIGDPKDASTWEPTYEGSTPTKNTQDQIKVKIRAKVKPADFGF